MPAALGLSAALTLAAFAQAGEALSPRISPETITVGDLLTYAVDVPLAPGETVTGPGAEAALGQWEVRGYQVQAGAGRATLVYALTAFETGTLEIPSLSLTIGTPAGQARTVRTGPAKVTVASVLEGEDTQPADIVGPLALREQPVAIGVRALVLLAALALTALLARFLWRRRRRRQAEEASRPDPPDVAALKALAALRAAGLPEAGEVKAHYSELSEILRTYLAARWGLRTLEETTSRIVRQMRGSAQCLEHAPVVEDLLREADLVKFAKARPEPPACWSAVEGVERLVRESALRFPVEAEADG